MAEENAAVEIAKIVGDVVTHAPAAVVGKVLPVDKLIDTLSRGIGLLYHPRHIKKAAAAKAESLLSETNAAELARDIRQRAKFRREVEALRHQANLEAIAAKAEKYLPADVSSEQVDPGWTAAFAGNAKNATRDDLQELWAKVLAGEVANPGSISKRTMSIIDSLSDKDAARFVKLACGCTGGGIVPGVESNSLPGVGLLTPDLVELVDRGLLHREINSAWHAPSGTQLSYFDEQWILENTTVGGVPIPCCLLTDAGLELLKVVDRHPISGFASRIGAMVRKSNPNCSIAVAPKPRASN